MELKEFVAEALADIIQGVLDAQAKLETNGRFINPRLSTPTARSEQQGRQISSHGQVVQNVNFDVAVTAAQSNTAKGGIAVVVAAIGIGSHAEASNNNSQVSRIAFSVPITLPNSEDNKG